MDDIRDPQLEPLRNPKFLKPFRLNYTQNNVRKSWELAVSHSAVVVIIYNTVRKKLVLVKQFRPAVYFSNCLGAGCDVMTLPIIASDDDAATVPHKLDCIPGDCGITYEFCAGIVDKKLTLREIAREEVLEECGYSVPLDSLERIQTYRSGVGTGGGQHTLFYVEVTDDMKVSAGGGLASEGEMIEVVEWSLEDARKYLGRKEVNSPGSFMFGLMWALNRIG